MAASIVVQAMVEMVGPLVVVEPDATAVVTVVHQLLAVAETAIVIATILTAAAILVPWALVVAVITQVEEAVEDTMVVVQVAMVAVVVDPAMHLEAPLMEAFEVAMDSAQSPSAFSQRIAQQ